MTKLANIPMMATTKEAYFTSGVSGRTLHSRLVDNKSNNAFADLNSSAAECSQNKGRSSCCRVKNGEA
jgi:hypothetical protein